jgi:exopolysaccharide production protein ExoZ
MKLWSIQVLRFVAALLVVHLHAVQRAIELAASPGLLGDAATVLGRCGVDIFFVISGYIITRTSVGLTAGEFTAKRLRRIVPIYVLMALPWVALSAYAGDVGWRDLAATFLFWPATDVMTPPLLLVGWTLCFEVLFYAAAALIIWRRWLLVPILGLFVVALAIRQGALLQFMGNPIIFEFLAGAVLALAPRWRWAIAGIPVGAAVLIAGAVLRWPPTGEAVQFLTGAEAWTRLATIGIPAVLIVWGTLQFDAKPGVLTYLGDASYSLYLVHPLVLFVMTGVIQALGTKLPADAVIALGLGMSVLAAWRVHELFEKPMLARLGKRVPAAA